jgi:hypothetical protein
LIIVILVVFGAFACLFPLAFYCLVVASWNGRRRPTLVSGPADFAGVLLATAGFTIFGGPVVLALLHESGRRLAEYHTFSSALSAVAGVSWPWLAVWAGYFVLVVGGSGWLLVRRRFNVVVYNIDPTDAAKLVPTVLDRLGLHGICRGETFYVGNAEPKTRTASAIGPQALPPEMTERGVLDVAILPSVRHMTLRWVYGDRELCRQVEMELRRMMPEMVSPPNPVANWLLTASTTVFALLLTLLGLFLWLIHRS